MAAGHGEDHIGGLRPHAAQGHQFLPRALRRQAEDPFEAVAMSVEEGLCDPTDSRRLLLRETGVPNRLCNLLLRSFRESLRGDCTDTQADVARCAAFIPVRRPLGHEERAETYASAR